MKKLIILIVSIALFACSTSSDPDPIPKIYFSPASANLSVGEQVNLSIIIEENHKSIFGISMQIAYDDVLLGFVDSTGFVAGTMFNQDAVNFVQSNGSNIHLSLTKINDPLSDVELFGSGNVATLTFRANNTGSSVIDILPDELFFYDSNGEQITISELNIESASINIQ